MSGSLPGEGVDAYRDLGFLVGDPPLPFVGSVGYLAGPDPDSTVVILALSLATGSLSFRRVDSEHEAWYRVTVAFDRGGASVGQLTADQVVRVATLPETLRRDESVIFQNVFHLAPGPVQLSVTVTDQYGTGYSAGGLHLEIPVFGPEIGISSLIPVHDAAARIGRGALPDLVVNPRGTVRYGTDTLRVYVEAYGGALGERVLSYGVVNWRGEGVLQGTVGMGAGQGDLAAVLLELPADQLPIGAAGVSMVLQGVRASAEATVLVTVAEGWSVASFADLLSLLRYFADAEALEMLGAAEAAARLRIWHDFWRRTDVDTATAVNEVLEVYLGRLREADVRFAEVGTAGWLTERAEVFANLGEPDQVYDSGGQLEGRQFRVISWVYFAQDLTLDFVEESGFGRFVLTPTSRADFQRVVNSQRRRDASLR
jgi:GWxTD domain-containing protein